MNRRRELSLRKNDCAVGVFYRVTLPASAKVTFSRYVFRLFAKTPAGTYLLCPEVRKNLIGLRCSLFKSVFVIQST